MTSLRKILAFLVVGSLAIVALPAMAGGNTGTKSFFASFPSPVVATSQDAMTITNNSTANGVSTINSMMVEVQNPGVIITGVQMTSPTVSTVTSTAATPIDAGYSSAVILTNFPGIKAHASAIFNLTLSGVTCGTTVTFNVYANSGNAFPGGDNFLPTDTTKLFTTFNCDGVLACPSLNNPPGTVQSYTAISGLNTTNLSRDENKDGSACVAIPFDVSFSNVDQNVTILWDQNTQPYAALETTTTFPPNLVDPATGLPRRLQFSLDGTNFYTAPTCLSSKAPAPYGTATNTAAWTSTTVYIDISTVPSNPAPATPFAWVVQGSSPERMLVTNLSLVSGTVYQATVVRGTGLTPVTAHSNGQFINSTPLPVSQFTAAGSWPSGDIVPVCIVEEDDTTQAFGTAGCPAQPAQAGSDTLLACYIRTAHLFILGDVTIKSP